MAFVLLDPVSAQLAAPLLGLRVDRYTVSKQSSSNKRCLRLRVYTMIKLSEDERKTLAAGRQRALGRRRHHSGRRFESASSSAYRSGA
jgi:hypothetical protein